MTESTILAAGWTESKQPLGNSADWLTGEMTAALGIIIIRSPTTADYFL